jgi:hypothetical protein
LREDREDSCKDSCTSPASSRGEEREDGDRWNAANAEVKDASGDDARVKVGEVGGQQGIPNPILANRGTGYSVNEGGLKRV